MFFFFKQKTAYEMRISDWSSDVCSSDLGDEIEGAGCEGTDADLLLQKIELIAVIGPTVTPEDRKAPLVVELIGKADARLPRTLERLPLGPRRDIIVDVVIGVDQVRIIDRKSTRLNSSH